MWQKAVDGDVFKETLETMLVMQSRGEAHEIDQQFSLLPLLTYIYSLGFSKMAAFTFHLSKRLKQTLVFLAS